MKLVGLASVDDQPQPICLLGHKEHANSRFLPAATANQPSLNEAPQQVQQTFTVGWCGGVQQRVPVRLHRGRLSLEVRAAPLNDTMRVSQRRCNVRRRGCERTAEGGLGVGDM